MQTGNVTYRRLGFGACLASILVVVVLLNVALVTMFNHDSKVRAAEQREREVAFCTSPRGRIDTYCAGKGL